MASYRWILSVFLSRWRWVCQGFAGCIRFSEGPWGSKRELGFPEAAAKGPHLVLVRIMVFSSCGRKLWCSASRFSWGHQGTHVFTKKVHLHHEFQRASPGFLSDWCGRESSSKLEEQGLRFLSVLIWILSSYVESSPADPVPQKIAAGEEI